MIFKTILWYALLKGVWKGLHKRPPMTVRDFDLILQQYQYYVTPIREQLNKRLPDWTDLGTVGLQGTQWMP